MHKLIAQIQISRFAAINLFLNENGEEKMKKLLTFLCAAMLVLGLAITSSAAPIFYQAANVYGTGTINYGIGSDINTAPKFSFVGSEGNVTSDFSSFTPGGEYIIDFSLTGLAVDANEDGGWYDLGSYSFTSAPITISSLPPATGNYGQLSWNVNLNSDFLVSYDFGATGSFTNAGVNAYLAGIDLGYSGAANGIMDANIRWNNLRVELNSTAPVPEPATLLLLGSGLAGLAFYRRKRK